MKLFPANFMLAFVVVGVLVSDSSAHVRGIHKRPFVADDVDKALHVPNLEEHFRVLKAGGPGALKMPAESFNKESKPVKQGKKKDKGAKSSEEKKKPEKEGKGESKSAKGAKPKALDEEAQGPEEEGEDDQLEGTTRAAKMGGGEAGKQSDSIDTIEETVDESETTVEEFDGILSVEDISETFDEADAADPELTKRSLTLLAIQYTTKSNQIPASLDYIELARVTRHLLSNLFYWYYGNFQNIKYELLEMHRYTVLAPTLVKFDVTLHFEEGDGVFVPTQADIQAAIDEQLYEGSDYANLYLNRLRNSAFGIFTATTSFRVITNGDDLQQLEEELNAKQGIEDFPVASGPSSWVNLVALLAILVLCLLLCVAVCTCCRRRRRRRLQRLERKVNESSQNEYRDPTDPDNDSTTGISEYRTNMFSDQEASLRSLQITPQEDENKIEEELEEVMDALEDVPLEDNEVPEMKQPPAKENNLKSNIAPADIEKTSTNRPVQPISTYPLSTGARKIPYRATQAVATLVSKPSWAVKANLAKSKSLETSITATGDSALNVTTEVKKNTLVQKKAFPVTSKPAWVAKSRSSTSSDETRLEPVHSVCGTESVENRFTVSPRPTWARKPSTESSKSDHSTSTNPSVTSDNKKLFTPPRPTWEKEGSNGSEESETKSVVGTTNEAETVCKTSHAPSLDKKSSVESGKSKTSEPMDRTTMSSSTKPIWASKNFLKPVNRDGSGQSRLWAQQETDATSKHKPQEESEAQDVGDVTVPENPRKEPASPEPVVAPSKHLPPVPTKAPTRNVSSEEKSQTQPQNAPSIQSISTQKETKDSDVTVESSDTSDHSAVDSSSAGLLPPASPEEPQTNILNKSTEDLDKKPSISMSEEADAPGKPVSESDEPAAVASGPAPEWMMKFKQMGLQRSEE